MQETESLPLKFLSGFHPSPGAVTNDAKPIVLVQINQGQKNIVCRDMEEVHVG